MSGTGEVKELGQTVTNAGGELLGEPAPDASGALDAPEWMPLANAAVQLAVSLPRLRRLLTRSDLSSLVETKTRQTRTGTRTAQGVNRSELFRLREALDTLPPIDDVAVAANENGYEPERERERGDELFEPFPIVDNPSSEVVYLRARLADALQLLAREQQAHAETRQIAARLMLTAEESANGSDDSANGLNGSNENGNENAGQTVPVSTQNDTQEATGGELRSDVGSSGQSVKTPWWAFWKR